MPKLCPNITFPHQQVFSPIRSVTKSSTARFSHENLVEKFKIFVQDFVPIRTALKVAVNTIVPRSPFFLFLYLKTQTVTHIRKNAVEYLRQLNGAICVIYNLCQRQKIR